MSVFKRISKSRPFLVATVLISLLLIGFLFAMQSYFPEIKNNKFGSFIIAFEFAASIQDINLLFQGLTIGEIKRIDLGNYIDFGFMLTYSFLIAYIFIRSAKEFKRKWLFIGLLFSAFILACDFLENLMLLKISEIYVLNENESLMIPLLKKLNVATWLKWGGLAFTFFIFYEVLVRLNWFYKLLGMVCLFPFLYILVTRNFTPEKISLLTSGIFVCFFVMIIFGMTYKKRPLEKTNSLNS